jgi:periplasmic divalent cation tolerance protein
MSRYCRLWLTCKDKAEADKIAKVLLDRKLIACAKQVPANSDYIWKDKIESAKEVLLLMESREDLFKKIEKEVTQFHSYDTFVLTATQLERISKKARAWLDESLEAK